MAGTISALKHQSKNRGRVNVFIDGEFAFGLSKILALNLRIGQVLDDQQILELEAEDSVEVAHTRALRWLNRRPLSEYELRVRWRRYDVSEEVQDQCLVRLRRSGLVDDDAFAQAWIENRNAFRPRSALMLRSELQKKGVSREVIETALENFDDDRAALEAARKTSHRLRDLPWEDFRRRLAGYLSRRGFNYSTVSPVVQRVWDEINGFESEAAS